MKQIVLPLINLEFTWLVIDGFMEENGLAPLSQNRNYVPPIQKISKKFEIFPAPSYKIRVYTIENKDTHTDYQKLLGRDLSKHFWCPVDGTKNSVF